MRADSAPDHGSLALLAQRDAASELRPLLLRVQCQSFASALRRDAAMIASFETIALGLLPLVTADAVSEAARILHGIDEVPASVLAALAAGRARDLAARIETLSGDLPPATTRAPSDLAGLVDRAVDRPDLAAILLARPDLTVFDRAALYRHADATMREAVRLDLGLALATAGHERPAGSGETARTILAIAEAGDPGFLIEAVASEVGTDPDRLEIASPAGQELFVLALVALGLAPEEILRILLVCGAPMSRSVEAVFRLSRLARTVPPHVAAHLVGRRRVAHRSGRMAGDEPARAAGTLRADGRADPARPATRMDQSRRDRGPIARLDRRS